MDGSLKRERVTSRKLQSADLISFRVSHAGVGWERIIRKVIMAAAFDRDTAPSRVTHLRIKPVELLQICFKH